MIEESGGFELNIFTNGSLREEVINNRGAVCVVCGRERIREERRIPPEGGVVCTR